MGKRYMKEGNFKLIEKEDLYDFGQVWRLRFEAPDIEAEPGQFVNIAVDGQFLRRPISVSEYEEGILSLVVQPVGEGTRRLVSLPRGSRVNMLTGLGNRFSLPSREGKVVLLLGGGVGYAPLVGLMKKIVAESEYVPFAVFGFNGEADVPLNHIQELRDEGFPVEYCTMTGEMGDNGNALEVMQEYIDHYSLDPAFFYTCGPLPMMRAVCRAFDFEGQVSMEARMGCGFGACMGCTIPTPAGPRRICKEGPVFYKSEILQYFESL